MVPATKEKRRQVERIATLASKRAKRIPMQDRGPCPKAWKAYLRDAYNAYNAYIYAKVGVMLAILTGFLLLFPPC